MQIITEIPNEVKLGENVFDYVNQFLAVNESFNYPQIIYDQSSEIPSQKIATFLNICVWSTKDNGGKQAEETQKWFYSDDEMKLKTVLFLDYFTEKDLNRFRKRIEEIQIQFPKLKIYCKTWLDSAFKIIERDKREKTLWSKIKKWLNN